MNIGALHDSFEEGLVIHRRNKFLVQPLNVWVLLRISGILISHLIQQELKLHLNQIEFRFVAMNCDLDIFFSENIRSDICQIDGGIFEYQMRI